MEKWKNAGGGKSMKITMRITITVRVEGKDVFNGVKNGMGLVTM